MKGRAEYENIKGKDLFEGKSPLSLWPWLEQNPGKHDKGMLVGERGLGKTFFAKKLAEEIPTNIYELDKKRLNWELYEEVSNPEVVIVDDIHYALQAMRLGRLKGSSHIKEEEILERMKNIKNDAKEGGTKVVYVADEAPNSLGYNFQEEKNKKEFLELFKHCPVSPDDITIMYQYLGEILPIKSDNVYKLRENIDDETAVNMRKEFGMKDIPLLIPPIKNSFKNYDEQKLLSELELHVSPHEPERIPEHICRVNPWTGRPQRNGKDEIIEWSPSNPFSKYESLNGQQKILTNREAKVLSEKFGGLSRENLSGNVSMSQYELEGYSPREIKYWKNKKNMLIRGIKQLEPKKLLTMEERKKLISKKLFLGRIKKRLKPEPIGLATNESGEWRYDLPDEVLSLQRILEEAYSDLIRKEQKLSPFGGLAEEIGSVEANEKEVARVFLEHELNKE